MRQIATSTLSNQNIASALLCHTYTADADRLLFVRLFADQVIGNGSYVAYITIQRLGTGSAYQVQPVTTATVASGVTAIAFTTIAFPVLNTDVVKVYLVGLAGDTTTPDIVTGIWEDDSLLPATAGNKLGVNATGQAGVDWGNVGNPTTTVALTGTTAGLISGAITSAKFTTDAIDANALKADAVTEIQSGLGTTANQTTIINALTTIASYIDTEVAAIKAKTDNLPPDPADASDIAAALATIAGYIDTEVATLITNVATIMGQTGTSGVVLSTATAATIADMVNSRGMSHIDGSADKYSIYHLIMSLLNGKQAAGSWIPYTTTGASIPGMGVPVDTDPDALPVVGTHGA